MKNLGPIVHTVVLCSLPAVLVGRVIEDYSSISFGVLAAIVGALVGTISDGGFTTKLRLRPSLKVLAMAVVGLVLTLFVAAVRPGFRAATLWRSWLDAMVYGWADLATSPIPALAEPRTLLPVVLVSYGASVVSIRCVRRPSGSLLMLFAPACALLGAAVAAGRHSFAAVPSAVCFVVLVALVLMVRARTSSGPSQRRPSPTGNQTGRTRSQNRAVTPITRIAIAGSTLATAVLIGPALTFGRDRQPFDPRDHVNPPLIPANAVSPLELVSSRRDAGDLPLFTVRSAQPLYPQDLRLVALNHFDGASWSTTMPYKRGGAVLDSVTRRTIAMSSVEAEVTLAGLDGPWLPSIGDPYSVVGTPVIVDSKSGSLVTTQPTKSGVTYAIKARRPEPEVEQLLTLPVGSSQEARDALNVPADMPPLLTEMARTAIGGVQLPFQRAVELRNYVRSSFTLNNAAPGGFSYGHLERAFVKEGSATDEQFATLFATLGRVVGLPTRVVVGFVPPPPDSNGLLTIRGAHARVWAEVMFEDVGWIPFTATPADDGTASSSVGFGGQDEVELRAAPAPRQPPPTVEQVAPAETVAQVESSWMQRHLRSTLIGVLLAVLLSGLALTGIALLKRRKTAQRRSGAPREAVIGAWNDVLDRLTEVGVSTTSVMTVEEVVEATEASSAVLAGLYRPVNRALYSDSEVTEADSEQAWRARDRFVRSLNRRSSFRQRLFQAVNPRPLFTSIDHTIGAQP